MAVASSARAVARIGSVCWVAWGSVCDRVAREKSSKRRRSTTSGTRAARARRRRAMRSTIPTRTASSSSGDRRRRPSACCVPIERRRTPTCTGRGSRLWASAWSLRPAARPTIATSAGSASRATWPTLVIPWSCSLAAVTGPDAPQPLDGQQVQEGELAAGRHHEQAVGLGQGAGHLGQELRPRHPDRDRQADALEDLVAQPHGDVHRRPRDAAAARGRRGRPRRSTAPSTSGDVSAKTSKTALLASE